MSNILVVEDEVFIRQSLCDLLELEGYTVSSAENGIEGLSKIVNSDVDLVICDIMMPKMDGYELLQSIRNDTRFHDLPFIFLSAKTEKEDREKGLALGANAYVTKPFAPHQLLEIIENLLK